MGQESEIEKAVAKYARSKGCYVRKFVSTSRAGVPDHYFLTPAGVSFFIEFKKPGEKPTPLQAREIKLINANRGNATWTDNLTSGKRIVDSYLRIEVI